MTLDFIPLGLPFYILVDMQHKSIPHDVFHHLLYFFLLLTNPFWSPEKDIFLRLHSGKRSSDEWWVTIAVKKLQWSWWNNGGPMCALFSVIDSHKSQWHIWIIIAIWEFQGQKAVKKFWTLLLKKSSYYVGQKIRKSPPCLPVSTIH